MFKLFKTFTFIVLLALKAVIAENLRSSLLAEVLREGKDENKAVSPLLLSEGLMQLYVGAEGRTADEIGNVLHSDDLTKGQAIEAYLEWSKNFKKPQGMNSGNRIYVAKDVNILPEYQKESMNLFNTTVGKVDFEDFQSTSAKINEWMDKQTEYNTTKYFRIGLSRTKVSLLSVIHYHGIWEKEFDEEKSGKYPFYMPQETGEPRSVNIDMMGRLDLYRHSYIEQLDADSVELPYADLNLTMVILLPRTMNGIDKVVDNINKLRLSEIVPHGEKKMVLITLPKFKVEVNMDLKDTLKQLGVHDLFKDANLKAMTDWKDNNLVVTDVFQMTMVEVDARGIKDLAAQAMIVNTYGNNTDAIEVKVNHPFLFIIKDADKIYFAGRISKLNENNLTFKMNYDSPN